MSRHRRDLTKEPKVAERPQRKMVDIEVVETSGVDHPAHLHEGWVVMKNAGAATVESLFGAPNTKKEVTPMAESTPATPSQEEYDALVAKNAELEAQNAELVAKAAKPSDEADSQEELLKSVPESVRQMLAKAAADAEEARAEVAKAREDVTKEREARLDAAAVAVSRETYKALAFDHEKVAPALRKFAAVDADTAAVVTELLKAADGQLESAGIFMELGKSSEPVAKSAAERIADKAAELRAADPALTAEVAFTKALESDAALYTDYLEGK